MHSIEIRGTTEEVSQELRALLVVQANQILSLVQVHSHDRSHNQDTGLAVSKVAERIKELAHQFYAISPGDREGRAGERVA